MRPYIFLLCLAAALAPAATAGAAEDLLLRTINGHSRVIYAAALSPDGKVLASASVDNTIKLWNVSDGSLLKALNNRAGYSNSLAFFPDGKRLASADADGVIRIWDAVTGALAEALGRRGDPALAVAVFPGGELLASGGADGTVRLWRPGSRRPVRAIRAHPGYVTAVAVSPDGKLLASASASEPMVRLWNAETGKAAGRLEGHSGAVTALGFSPSGERLVSAGEDGAVKVWGLSGGLCMQTFKSNKAVNAAAYSPDGAYIFSAGADDSVSVWKADGASAPMAVLEGHAGVIKALAVAGDGRFLATGGFDKALKIWLTPWEAQARKAAVAAAEEKARKFDEHYKAGLTLLTSPTMDNLRQASQEFTQALSFRDDPDCRAKLGEASAALVAKEKQRRLLAANALRGLAVVFFLLAISKFLGVARRNSRERVELPDEIKRQTLLGSYDRALDLYKRYRAIGGDPGKLHAAELRDLYHSLRAIDELPKENLPYSFFLGWAAAYAKEGNYRLAALMLRDGQLAEEFGKPEDFDALAAIYRQAHGMAGMLAVRLKPGTYSSLAEAFARAGDHAGCLKAFELKQQFHPGSLSARDHELLAAARKNVPEPGAA